MSDTGRRVARRMHGEDGASLIIALSFLLLFSLILVALLAYAVTSFGAGGDVSDRQRAGYAADAAVDTAVQRIRQDPDMRLGRKSSYDGSAPTCDLTYQPSDGTADATATCTPQDGSGAVRPGVDGPANAILTTSGDITASDSGKLKTNGNVFSNGGIALNNGATLDAYDNAVTARGSCTPSVPGSQWVAVQTQCNVTSAVTAPQFADGAVPNWTSQLSGTLPFNPPPSCNAQQNGSNILTFSQGYYTDTKKLTSIPSGCTQGVYYFSPGVYVFNISPKQNNGAWNINGVVVGGKPQPDSRGAWYPSPSRVPDTPGATTTAAVACDPGQDGVQFILSGATQLVLSTSGSSIELCPRTSDPNHIAIYGVRNDAGPSSPQQTYTLNPSNFSQADYAETANLCGSYPGASGGGVPTQPWCTLSQPPPPTSGPTTPLNGAIDSLVATGVPTVGNAATEKITFGGFDWHNVVPADQEVDVPAGLRIDSIQVRISHQEPGGSQPNTFERGSIAVWIPVQGFNGPQNAACTVPSTVDRPNPAGITPGPLTSLNDETRDCTGPIIGQISKTRGGQDISASLNVQYTVTADKKQTLIDNAPLLDGIQVIIKATPIVQAENGCTTGEITPVCSFFQNPTGTGHAGIWGNVFVPNAFLGVSGAPLSFGGNKFILFNLGVIVSSLSVQGLPADDAIGRFRIGDGTGRTVVLESTDGPARVRALVRIVDSATASPHGFLAVVRQWSTAKP